jgi:hypothetical protein
MNYFFHLIQPGEITVTECSDAVNEMKLNKSPGLDGLVISFNYF